MTKTAIIISIALFPFYAYVLSKVITAGILIAKKQLKEKKDGEKEKE